MLATIAAHLASAEDIHNLARSCRASYFALPGATAVDALARRGHRAASLEAIAATLSRLEQRIGEPGPTGSLSLPQCIPVFAALLCRAERERMDGANALILDSLDRIIGERTDRDAADLWSGVIVRMARHRNGGAWRLFDRLVAQLPQKPLRWQSGPVTHALAYLIGGDTLLPAGHLKDSEVEVRHEALYTLLRQRNTPRRDLWAWLTLSSHTAYVGIFQINRRQFQPGPYLQKFHDLMAIVARLELPDRGLLLCTIAALPFLFSERLLGPATAALRRASLELDPLDRFEVASRNFHNAFVLFLLESPGDAQVRAACERLVADAMTDLEPRFQGELGAALIDWIGKSLNASPLPHAGHLAYLRRMLFFLERVPARYLPAAAMRALSESGHLHGDLLSRLTNLEIAFTAAAPADPQMTFPVEAFPPAIRRRLRRRALVQRCSVQ